jgi:hypothetical protein
MQGRRSSERETVDQQLDASLGRSHRDLSLFTPKPVEFAVIRHIDELVKQMS